MANFLDHHGLDSGLTKEQWCEQLHPAVKFEAKRRILKTAPEWRQRNAAVDLQSSDADVRAAAQAVIDAVSAIRTKSNEIEAGLPSKSDAEILAFDARDDDHWK
tara:strand:+ start:350 stop:661 length:312 start_codon:yes stop_codon:yes gene_type:complete